MVDGDDRCGTAVNLLRSVLYDAVAPAEVPPELRDVEGFETLFRELTSLRTYTTALSHGDLNASLDMRGRVSGALKGLQANLRHLTWQTQAVAAGDLTQRVQFLGEFATAFNTMVDHLQELQDQLREQAVRDDLTGLLNRRYLVETMPRELARATREGRPLAVMMIDVDHFKQVNDVLGHAAGDQVLRALGGLLRAMTRASDVACRWGGEEFVVVLPGAPVDAGARRAEDMRLAFQSLAFPDQASRAHSTFSVGLAVFPAHGETPEALLEAADRALYRAKEGGRNCVRVASQATSA
jgi:diguanylate cyclase (GGDEF)-like protein